MTAVRDGCEANSHRKNRRIPANPGSVCWSFSSRTKNVALPAAVHLQGGFACIQGLGTLKPVSPKVTSEAVTLLHYRQTAEAHDTLTYENSNSTFLGK